MDSRFTAALDAGGCPSEPIDAGACSEDAGTDDAAAACSASSAGAGGGDVAGFALVMVAAVALARRARRV